MTQFLDSEAAALAKFDSCVQAGKIFYDDSAPNLFTNNGFDLEFRVTAILRTKPYHGRKDPSRTKAFEPFSNPDPESLIGDTGTHYIIFNKYNVYRPMLVLPTKEYASQHDDLDDTDIDAGWRMLHGYERPYAVIYNCGTKAGSSIGHKHMQAFPLPDHPLWPSKASSESAVAAELSGVPFVHFVLRIPSNSQARDVYQIYQKLLVLGRQALTEAGSESRDYNFVFTRDWAAVIPRRTSNGPIGANAFGMLGLIIVPDEWNRSSWEDLGYEKFLGELGVAKQI